VNDATPSWRHVEAFLTNWERWCNDQAGIFPHCPTNWEQFPQLEYKNCHETTDEKLELVLDAMPIDERAAERIELWVAHFDPFPQQALRTHYVYMPDKLRCEWRADAETWLARRAAWTASLLRKLGLPRRVTVDVYEAAVNEGVRQVRERLLTWERGA
jgi:hypothetical protein